MWVGFDQRSGAGRVLQRQIPTVVEDETAQAWLSRLLCVCALVTAWQPMVLDAQSQLPSMGERCACALAMAAACTQLPMMLASSLRASVTDGGSAGLCPLEKEWHQSVSSTSASGTAKPMPRH